MKKSFTWGGGGEKVFSFSEKYCGKLEGGRSKFSAKKYENNGVGHFCFLKKMADLWKFWGVFFCFLFIPKMKRTRVIIKGD